MGIPESAVWVRVPRFFGDAMMIHAAIAPLRAAGLPLVMWGPEWIVDLFRGSEDYQAVVAEGTRKYGVLDAARMLRAHRPSALVAFPKSQRPYLAALLAGVSPRLGCGDGLGSLLLTHSIAFYKQDTPFVERYASVVRRAFPELPDAPFRPFRPRAEAMEAVQAERGRLGLGEYVVFALGANSSSKRLSVDLWIDLGRRLEAQGLKVVMLGSGDWDIKLAAEIRAGLPSALDRIGSGGLAHSAAWICGARALVGLDSGLGHVAAGAGVPTLAVYGPTRPRHSSPWGPRVRVVVKPGLSCIECMLGACPYPEHPCMRALDPEVLWAELQAVMG